MLAILWTLSLCHTVRGRKNQGIHRNLILSTFKIALFFSQLTHPVAWRAEHVEGVRVAPEAASALGYLSAGGRWVARSVLRPCCCTLGASWARLSP